MKNCGIALKSINKVNDNIKADSLGLITPSERRQCRDAFRAPHRQNYQRQGNKIHGR